jgi:hypothetical protein
VSVREHEFADANILSAPDVGGVLGGTADMELLHYRVEPTVLPTATLRCTCTKTHPGRPHGVTGCGIYFTLTVTPDEP